MAAACDQKNADNENDPELRNIFEPELVLKESV